MNATAMGISLSSFGATVVKRQGQAGFVNVVRHAGADSVEIRSALLDAMPANCPWAVEFPLVGDDPVAVTRKEICRLKEMSGERYVD